MYRVMPTEPDEAGGYEGVEGVPSEVQQEGPFEVVFKVPRLDAYITGPNTHYTIVLPKYVADEIRQQAEEQKNAYMDANGTGDHLRMTINRLHPHVYITYASAEPSSYEAATYLLDRVQNECDASCHAMQPEDGTLRYVDFESAMKDYTHFMACMTSELFESLERQEGRFYLELLAAVHAIPGQRIVLIYPESLPLPSSQRIQQLSPLELRKAFVTKPLIMFDNMGHMDLFETALCRFLGVEHSSELLQLPMSSGLLTWNLGHLAKDLYERLGCTTLMELYEVGAEEVQAALKLDTIQMQKFQQMLQHETLHMLLEFNAVEGLLRSRNSGKSGHVAAAKEGVHLQRIADLTRVTTAQLRDACAADAAMFERVKALRHHLQTVGEAACMDSMRGPPIPEHLQGVKMLVTKLWSPNVAKVERTQAAEHIRRKSLNVAGLEEILHIAGLESLIKLAEEGSSTEKISALWSLRNFALVDLYRTRMASKGVLQLCLTILDDGRQRVGVHHAAASVLQMLTSADLENVKLATACGAVGKVINGLRWKQRAMRVALLAALSNLVVLDENKEACAKMLVVPRLVAFLDASAPADVRAMAVSTLCSLVVKDANRLKTWRCGGVDKLQAIIDAKIPKVSSLAAQTMRVLMAGPRIHPQEHFITKHGRRLSAEEMRSAIQRLNFQDSFLLNVNASLLEFESARPAHVAAQRPHTAAAIMQRPRRILSGKGKEAAGLGAEATGQVEEDEGSTPRDASVPQRRPWTSRGRTGQGWVSSTAVGPERSVMPGGLPATSWRFNVQEQMWRGGAPLGQGFSIGSAACAYQDNYCTDYMRKLMPDEQSTLVHRLVYSKQKTMGRLEAVQWPAHRHT